MTQQKGSPPLPQRWERPLLVEPGFWKRQLAGNYLRIASKGDMQTLRQLLDDHPGFLNKRGSHNRTLLWEATRSGKLAAVQWLVEHGAEVDAAGCYNGETHVQVSPYCAAIYYKRSAVATYLLTQSDPQDVFRSAFLGDLPRVAHLLGEHPEWLNAEDPHDSIYYIPLLSFAVAGGHAAVAEFLLGRGAVVGPYSAQLLYLAARVPRMHIVELLLAHGADVRAVDTGIFVAVSELSMLRYLLSQGASATQLGKNGFPPLVYVARGDKGEHPEKIQLLVKHGADVNAAGPMGRTALHYAAAAGSVRVIKVLIEHGARPDLQDQQGQTALSLARAAGKIDAVEVLGR